MIEEEALDQIRVIGAREGRLAEHSIVCGKEEGFLNRMVSIPRHGGRKREEESIGSGGRPRLNLKPRTLTMDDGQKGSEIESDAKPKGNNPFGEARPREEALKDLGHDVKAIEEKLESTKIKGVAVAADDDRRKDFWIGKGREPAWRKPEAVDSRPERMKNL